MSTSQVLHYLCALDKSSSEFSRSLYTFLRLDEKGEYSHNLQESESAQLVNLLDQALDVIPVTDVLFRRCLRQLRLICGHHNVLPLSYITREGLKRVNNSPVAGGGFADVWEGTYEGRTVCVKVLRIENENTKTTEQRNALAPFYGEAVVWKRLNHPNVVRFLGVTTTPLQIVSEWMPNGILPDYVKANPSVDRLGLLLDVAEGLNYLHSCHTLHGDLKGPNILVDSHGHARVSDFGLASIAYGKHSLGLRSDKGRTVRWSAPEVLFGTVSASKQADMFAFGMVVVEVFTGNVPFHNIVSTLVSFKTMNGERPSRPRGAETLGLSDPLWKMTEFCWEHDPKDRLGSSEVVDLLREMYVASPSNPLSGAIRVTQELAGSSSMTPGIGAGLSPKLLDILQHREPTPRPELADGMTQQSGGADQGQNGHHFALPLRSGTLNTIGSDSPGPSPSEFWSAVPTFPRQKNQGQVSEPLDISQGPPETPLVIPRISIHPLNSISATLNSGVLDGYDIQHPTPTDVGTGRGAQDSRNDVGENRASKPGLQRPIPSGQKLDGPHQGLSTLSTEKPKLEITNLGLIPMERTKSRGSSIGKAVRSGIGGLLNVFGLGGGGSKPSTRATTPIADQGDNSKLEVDGGPGGSDTHPRKTGGAKKGGWGRIRGVVKVVGLRKQVQAQSNDSREK